MRISSSKKSPFKDFFYFLYFSTDFVRFSLQKTPLKMVLPATPKSFFPRFRKRLGDKPFPSQYGFHKFPFIFRIKYAEGEVYKLGLGHDKRKILLVYLCSFDHVPLDGHSLLGVDFHQDLPTVNFIGEPFKHDFILLHLAHAGKLYHPKQ